MSAYFKYKIRIQSEKPWLCISVAGNNFYSLIVGHSSISVYDVMPSTGWSWCDLTSFSCFSPLKNTFSPLSLRLSLAVLPWRCCTRCCWKTQSAPRAPRARTTHQSIISVSPCRSTYITTWRCCDFSSRQTQKTFESCLNIFNVYIYIFKIFMCVCMNRRAMLDCVKV